MVIVKLRRHAYAILMRYFCHMHTGFAKRTARNGTHNSNTCHEVKNNLRNLALYVVVIRLKLREQCTDIVKNMYFPA